MSIHDIPHATIAQTDIYFAAVWFAFCFGVIVGFALAGGFADDKRTDQEDQTTADT